MSSRTPGASAGDPSPETRPLPPRPSLEFERKQAKALLRQLRAGNSEAFARARARHGVLRPSAAEITLADAQLVIAREYGFASWPRLVQYFGNVERRQRALRYYRLHDREFYERSARSLISMHRNRRAFAGSSFAASVPRFYGKTVEEVFESTVTEEDARLTVARQFGHASWEVLMQGVAAEQAQDADPWRGQGSPFDLARTAIIAGDLDALSRVIADHPELLRPSDDERRDSRIVVAIALGAEQRGVAGARAITDWLASQGADVQSALNERLCGRGRVTLDDVRFLLDRGADPDWIAPSGLSVIEHALLRFWSGEMVDLIARRATPKRALWIAAGLGDVDGVGRFLDRNGRPTAAAYRDRPDFVAAGERHFLPLTPVPDDAELLAEAFFVAMLNDRTEVLDYMIDRGFPIDYLGWEMPLVCFAVGNQRVRAVECLVRRGANLDLKGRQPDMSARELSREMLENMPTNPSARRIFELCGAGDADQVIAELEARPAPEPQVLPNVQEALAVAADDAARHGSDDVKPEHLLIGILRLPAGSGMDSLRRAGIDMDRLHAEIGTRVLPADDRVTSVELPLHGTTQGVLSAATTLVRKRKGDVVSVYHVLLALCDTDDAFMRDLLIRCGSSVATLRERLGESIH